MEWLDRAILLCGLPDVQEQGVERLRNMTKDEFREEFRSMSWGRLFLFLLTETSDLFPPAFVGFLLGLASGLSLAGWLGSLK